ncbi:hypothetical protein [Acidomonas methanolica]|uniref:Uncharacterized protein n=1 Tax=Acidomonas methanolica NBRC 104435 TaxID=1231351 RepID=A0A023D1T6_ACIMT|nr:hypothetical protein [Acidomonas methanolica]MBU2654597.1 hypothetical protein [Acidomonas methanolica]TCS27470.1 hypothetical protein EDC31_11074 [Acidomonas methanolica]GAJ28049.1 hypothetical protein Amme_013_013 [Acidomonas methanolica NBRC 104435]GBQ59782.1 hypothetical protein AA0498_2795 [Acidomonas methanolica]GEK98623.1 hypothetical protein AME01nite_11220 [Acidomonas methanolica NBRC 104435]
MIRKFALAALAFGLTLSPLAPLAHAKAPCRDGKGRFTKCEAPAPKKCRDEKGRFTACDAAKSAPAPKAAPTKAPATPN